MYPTLCSKTEANWAKAFPFLNLGLLILQCAGDKLQSLVLEKLAAHAPGDNSLRCRYNFR